jgi:hypothetical protein
MGQLSLDVDLAQPDPFVCHLPHVLGYSAFSPGHEGSIESERLATLTRQKPTNVLGDLVSVVNFSGPVNRISMPVKFHRGSPSQGLLPN